MLRDERYFLIDYGNVSTYCTPFVALDKFILS